ncbi:uncharacterized protein N7529_004385 [Penicillium soppii]|jgi:hypothetical protein|uniref:uncharacterized protein n=1 Tax=Penicillium soppii TaxID=69789 RepID=UPI00254678E6|nr:uncharacterized protein N7529_004385 [Penicillium soppii]KAJ5872032.1 hypothetical protein N7529_004385 [Penicillium soppii]
MENKTSKGRECSYHEKWYILESSIKQFIEELFSRLPSEASSEGRGVAANHLAQVCRILGNVKFDASDLALKFPQCTTICNKPPGYFDGDYQMMCEFMRDTLNQAVVDVQYPQHDSRVRESLNKLYSHILQYNER